MPEDEVKLPWESGEPREDILNQIAAIPDTVPDAPVEPAEPAEQAGMAAEPEAAGPAPTGMAAEPAEPEAAADPLEGVEERIAELVRENTRAGRPTCLDDLLDLAPGGDPDALGVRVAGMVRDEDTYADIKVAATPSEALYLFSETDMTPVDAVAKAEADDICRAVAAKVREDSQEFARLTTVESLYGIVPQANPGRVQDALAAMAGDPAYADIQQAGARFLYSTRYMTDSYATILKRAAANDPIATIVETVRDDSRIYPRPTNLRSFEAEVYNIDTARLDEYADRLLRQAEYDDIQEIRASTGARYLYSKAHLDGEQAKAIVEWEEVGKLQYP